jgi:hypothetical protein
MRACASRCAAQSSLTCVARSSAAKLRPLRDLLSSSLEERSACFETRAFRALLSMRGFEYAMHHILILRSGPKDRVSKDAKSDLQADLALLNRL